MLLFYTTYIVPWSVFIPAIFGLLYYKYLPLPYRIILGFVIFSGLVNSVNLFMMHILHMQTIIIFHIYAVFEFLFLSMFYRCFQNKTGRNFIAALMALFTVLCVVNFVFFQKINAINTYTRTFEAVIIMAYCVQFIFTQSDIDMEKKWGENGLNWINAGILIYYSSGIFLFMSSNYLIHADIIFNDIVWAIIDTMLVVEYILYAIGFYKCRAQQTISLSS